MHHRAHEPGQATARRTRNQPLPAEHAVLALQRGVGNQAMLRMLAREPAPSRLKTDPVNDLDSDGWAADVRGGQKNVELYAELATLLQASKLDDVAGTAAKDINTALRPEAASLKPGLNFVARLEPRGQTGFLIGGEYTGKLPTTRTGPEPKVAILISPRAFDPANKAAALGVLRHEMEHAFHDQLAANLLKRWRADPKLPFEGWLEKQNMSAVDRALVRERIPGTKVNTEALAHLEGFIAGFPVEAPGVEEGAHRVYENELVAAAEKWLGADKAVQDEFITRLKAFKGRMKGERLSTLTAGLTKLKSSDKAYAPLVDPVLR